MNGRTFLLTLLVTVQVVMAQSQADLMQIRDRLESIQGIEADQVSDLMVAFSASDETPITVNQLEQVERLVSAGLFEEVEADRIVAEVTQATIALNNGAPVEKIEDLILIAFAEPLSADELFAGARALQNLENTDIDAEVYLELISYGLINHWGAETVLAAGEGLILGKEEDVDVQKLALAVIIRIDQGLDQTSVQQMILDEIEYLKKRYTVSGDEQALRRKAFEAMQRAVERGVPLGVARELSFVAIEKGWSLEVIDAVFEGMIRGSREGLTPETLASTLSTRFSIPESGLSPERVVNEVLEFIRKNEQVKLAVLDRSRLNELKVIEAKPDPPAKSNQRETNPKETPSLPPKPDTPKQDRQRSQMQRVIDAFRLNMAIMQQTIQSYLGVPYVWGGTTRRGTDCSGFVQSVFREQGILLPRVSRQQYTVGQPVQYNNLKYGDLIFFNKYGYGRISHVGIYMGNGYFVHASCSKGVTMTKLTKRYYLTRFAGARRLLAA